MHNDPATSAQLKTLSQREGEALLRWSESYLVAVVAGTSPLEQPNVPVLRQSLGAFVTLRKGSGLRGCVGTLAGTAALQQTLPKAVRDSAVADHRFHPVEPSELPSITVELSLLGRAYPKATPAQIALGHEGVILAVGKQRGIFLPDVPTERKWDLRTTLNMLSLKAGLPEMAWQQKEARLYGFRSMKIKREGSDISVRLL